MNIAVICEEQIEYLPPVLSLLASLKRLDLNVTLITRDDSTVRKIGIPIDNAIVYGQRPKHRIRRKIDQFNARRTIREELDRGRGFYDVVWTTTDISAREAGKALYDYKHVMQLMELVERVPLFFGKVPFRNKTVEETARRAWKVVVPEYNRAYMQQVYWSLPKVPYVLPNKPAYHSLAAVPKNERYNEAMNTIKNERRKIVLYQGIFTHDRDLSPFAKAIERLGDEYVLYLMGRTDTPDAKNSVEMLVRDFSGVTYLGFIEPPNHLDFAKYAYIGLMPYVPLRNTRMSPFNAIYCAPNKIWEYTQFGLPVLSSDVPGIRLALESGDFGCVADISEEESIARAIKYIDSRHDIMSLNARKYYDSIDFDAIVADILEL